MLRNYFITALRNISKNKLFAFVNVFGLTIALTACLLIACYVQYEFSFDSFHVNRQQIYRVTSHWNNGKEYDDMRAVTVPWTGPGAKQLFPEIKEHGRLAPATTFFGKKIIHYDDVKIEEDEVFFADPGFINMFSFPVVAGNAETMLSKPYSIVLAKSIVTKYFQEPGNILGKSLTIMGADHLPQGTFEVTGVIEDPPANSHIQFDVLISFSSIFQGLNEGSTWWHWDYTYNYLWLNDGADPDALGRKMSSERKRLFAHEMSQSSNDQIDFILQPLRDIHINNSFSRELGTSNDPDLLQFLILVGAFTLAIGYINYVNLSLANSMERAKEFGLRIALGAERRQLMVQFVVDSLILNLIALVLSGLLIACVLPLFSEVTEANLSALQISLPQVLLCTVGLLLFGTLVSGLYPAFAISSYNPIAALKSSVTKKVRSVDLRKVLVVVQFVSAIVLLGCALTVFQQFTFMKNYQIGANVQSVLLIEGLGTYNFNRYQAFKSELLREQAVTSVSSSSGVPGDDLGIIKARLLKKDGSPTEDMFVVLADDEYFRTLEMKLLKGRTFETQGEGDKTSVILNETAVKSLGYSNNDEAVNDNISWEEGSFEHGGKQTPLIGIVQTHLQRSVMSPAMPIIYLPRRFYNPSWTKQYYVIRYNASAERDIVQIVKKHWDKSFRGDPFHYTFLDDHFELLFRKERIFGTVFAIFTAIAIFVAALGLLGLSTYTISQRSKELAVRKVLYARDSDIVRLLSLYYIKLVLLAYLIGMPLCYYFMSRWLESYQSRIKLGWWFFVVPAISTLLVAILSIAYQTIKAAVTPAVRSLKEN